jgi:hypothetical protein
MWLPVSVGADVSRRDTSLDGLADTLSELAWYRLMKFGPIGGKVSWSEAMRPGSATRRLAERDTPAHHSNSNGAYPR